MRFISILIFISLIGMRLLSCSASSSQKETTLPSMKYYTSNLFHDVQIAEIFSDSKTFADCSPKQSHDKIIELYKNQKKSKEFDLKKFVFEHFEVPETFKASFKSDKSRSMEEHIELLWSKLKRNPDKTNSFSSLVPLPKSYIVPGGRFREIYYWDSYFTIEGLLLSNPLLAEDMVDNFAFLIDSLGFIPNGNRNYYLTRSQPPFFALMVNAISKTNKKKLTKYLPQLKKEYAYWMQKSKIVKIDGNKYNRYYDIGKTPRPESYREDFELAEKLESAFEKEKLYSNLRTGAMSGWDYSSRWFSDNKNLSTIEITDIVPVDLNCLLYYLENLLYEVYKLNGNTEKKLEFALIASKRKENILKLFWNPQSQFFEDFHITKKEHTKRKTLAGTFPLFMKIATKQQAESVKKVLLLEFLQPGGFVTSLQNTGQQWDAPNGWAPLQWITINGLRHYGYNNIANNATKRWLSLCRKVYKNTGKMMEKYNVMDTTLQAGGGEYPNQDGFGWTNGVTMALLNKHK